MPGKGCKVFSRSVVHYLDTDVEAEGSSRAERAQSGIDSPVTLEAIRQIVTQEVGKIETIEELCKSMNVWEQKVDSNLTFLTQKIEAIEISQRFCSKSEEIKNQVVTVKGKTLS